MTQNGDEVMQEEMGQLKSEVNSEAEQGQVKGVTRPEPDSDDAKEADQ